MDILLYLAIAIIIIYISGLVYALIPKEKVKIAAPNVDTDKRLFKSSRINTKNNACNQYRTWTFT